ncbi:Conserved_hypothetical protein [Hexamita inflata]|uniref:Transmembrane protein n=1 Tax=Hexamita inflata TaxID=28002 RepID=A0AA86UIH9_9EUKA|nr:Conserved hypothetical protein [Hexamita inflata]
MGSSIELIQDSNVICINFEPSTNLGCNTLARGLNISVTLNELPNSVYDYIYDFNYSQTTKFCFLCSDCIGTTFYKSNYAKISMNSVAKITHFTVGQIYMIQSDYSQCFYESRYNKNDYQSQLSIEKNKFCFKAASTFRCSLLTKLYSINNISIQLTFFDKEALNFIYSGETVDNSYSVESGIFPDGSKYQYHIVCFQTIENLYNYFTFSTFYQAQITFNVSLNNIFRILSTKAHIFQIKEFENPMSNFIMIPATNEYQFRGSPNNKALQLQNIIEQQNIEKVIIKLVISPWNTAELNDSTYYAYINTNEKFNFSSSSNYITCISVQNVTECKQSIQEVRNMQTSNMRITTQYYFYKSDLQVIVGAQNIINEKINNCWNELIGTLDATGISINISYYQTNTCIFDQRSDIALKLVAENDTINQHKQIAFETNLSFKIMQQFLRIDFNLSVADLINSSKHVMLQVFDITDRNTIIQELQMYNITTLDTRQPLKSIIIDNFILYLVSLLIAVFYSFCKQPIQQQINKMRLKKKNMQNIVQALQSQTIEQLNQ